MKNSAASCAIIGGADGPTGIFLAGRKKKRGLRGLKQQLRSRKCRKRRERVKRRIEANPHTLEETIQYMIEKYGAVELDDESHIYATRRKECKASLVQRWRADLLGEYQEMVRPDMTDEQSVKEFMERAQKRQEAAAKVSEDVFPFDYHLFYIRLEDWGEIYIEIERNQAFIGGSSSASDKGKMKDVQRRVQDIYRYYGVSEEDIAGQTERYKSLVVVLADL